MKELMDSLRKTPPKNIFGDYPVKTFRDYKTSVVRDLSNGNVSDTGLPKSDVLYYNLENGSKVVIRPSGTEPKIKIYYLLHAENGKSASEQAKKLKSAMDKFVYK